MQKRNTKKNSNKNTKKVNKTKINSKNGNKNIVSRNSMKSWNGLSKNVLLSKGSGNTSFGKAENHKRWGSGVKIRGNDFMEVVATNLSVTPGTNVINQLVNPASFPGTRLSQLAPLWERYQVRKWEFCYIPSVAATEPGQFVGYPEYDPDEPLPSVGAALQTAFASMDAQVWNVYDCCCIEFGRVDPFTDLFVDPDASAELRLSTVGQLNIFASSNLTASKSYGSIVMYYDIDFYIPQINPEGEGIIGNTPNPSSLVVSTPVASSLSLDSTSIGAGTSYVQNGSMMPPCSVGYQKQSNGGIYAGVITSLGSGFNWQKEDVNGNATSVAGAVGDSVYFNFVPFDARMLFSVNQDGSTDTPPYTGSTGAGWGSQSPFVAWYPSLETAANAFNALFQAPNQWGGGAYGSGYSTLFPFVTSFVSNMAVTANSNLSFNQALFSATLNYFLPKSQIYSSTSFNRFTLAEKRLASAKRYQLVVNSGVMEGILPDHRSGHSNSLQLKDTVVGIPKLLTPEFTFVSETSGESKDNLNSVQDDCLNKNDESCVPKTAVSSRPQMCSCDTRPLLHRTKGKGSCYED
jgi:hypothetical protein